MKNSRLAARPDSEGEIFVDNDMLKSNCRNLAPWPVYLTVAMARHTLIGLGSIEVI